MGDYGRLYVPLESVPVYKEVLLPLADIICPNQTEAE
jgi:pyridoxine kinase